MPSGAGRYAGVALVNAELRPRSWTRRPVSGRPPIDGADPVEMPARGRSLKPFDPGDRRLAEAIQRHRHVSDLAVGYRQQRVRAEPPPGRPTAARTTAEVRRAVPDPVPPAWTQATATTPKLFTAISGQVASAGVAILAAGDHAACAGDVNVAANIAARARAPARSSAGLLIGHWQVWRVQPRRLAHGRQATSAAPVRHR